MYYKQTYRTSCLLDAACQVCKINPRDTLKLFIKEHNKEDVFHRGGYLKYSPIIRLLRKHNFSPEFIESNTHAVIELENGVEMILGVNLSKDDKIGALHAVYYDGKRVWEGISQEFISPPKDLKIRYAIICYNNSHYIRRNHSFLPPESLAWDWDSQKRNKKNIGKSFTGQMEYLKVV